METINTCFIESRPSNVSTLPIRNGNVAGHTRLNSLATVGVSTLPIRNGNESAVTFFNSTLNGVSM